MAASHSRASNTFNTKTLHLFAPGKDKRSEEGIVINDLSDPLLDELLDSQANELRQEIALLEGAANPFDIKEYLRASQTPVFFGGAINNFGVKELLDAFLEIAPPPVTRPTATREVNPDEDEFSGFVFKIQANMDPAHRDPIAFLRICSGKFQRGMRVLHHRIGKEVSLANATIFMAQDRTNVEEAYPDDIIGIYNHGTIKIGDTFTQKEFLKFTGIPHFAPEHFCRVRLKDPLRMKHLQKGLIQLSEEGAIQVFKPLWGSDNILGAVGSLQFDVTMTRLKDEYSVYADYEKTDYAAARWVTCDDTKLMEEFQKKNQSNLNLDTEGNLLVYLAASEWRLSHTMEEWPKVQFHKTMEKS